VPDIKAAINAGEPVWAHAFEYACAKGDIDHRLTKPRRVRSVRATRQLRIRARGASGRTTRAAK
jgi:hypothetical protein